MCVRGLVTCWLRPVLCVVVTCHCGCVSGDWLRAGYVLSCV